MKTPEQSKYLPEHFTEQDKIDYEIYVAESERIFSKIHPFVIHTGVIAYINEQKGLRKTASDEDVKACMDSYDLRTSEVVIETPKDPDFKMEDTLKPIIMVEDDSSSNTNRPRLDTVVDE